MIKRAVAICHYNRQQYLPEILTAVKNTAPSDAKIVLCDDGSTGESVSDIAAECGVILISGPNKGVAANKNRALWACQDAHYLCILEDDLIPREDGWFELYEEASRLSGMHHFNRVQDREVEETIPAFSAFMKKEGNMTPIYGPSPRGDLTFLTSAVIHKIGGFNPRFRGAGFAHGEWSTRAARTGLIGHPLRWVDIKEARDKIHQIGDREGGRWDTDVSDQLARNRKIFKELQKTDYRYHDLVLE